MYYVYILLLKNGQHYTDYAKDLTIRVSEHKRGKVKSTAKRLPVKLIYYEAYLLKSDAQRRERFLKTTEGKRLLRMQLRDLLKKVRVN